MGKLIPKHQTPSQPLVLLSDNTRVAKPYIESIPLTETDLYKQYLADPYRNTDFRTWVKNQALIQSNRKDEQIRQRTIQDEVASKIIKDRQKQEKINKDAYYRSGALRLGNTVSSLGTPNYALENQRTLGNLSATTKGAGLAGLATGLYFNPIPTTMSFLGGAVGQDGGEKLGTYLETNHNAPKYTSNITSTLGGLAGGLWGWKQGQQYDKQLFKWWNNRNGQKPITEAMYWYDELPYTPLNRNFKTISTNVVQPKMLINRGVINEYPGFQLKSLMKGNALEKQLSKLGTISVNSVLAHIKKASEFEQELIKKVLDEKFKGQKNVSYNQLRQAVQDELIPYERTPQTKWATYGMDRLGFKVKKEHDGVGGIVEYILNVPINTFTFNSPRIPIGDDKHYDLNTLGHSRTFVDPNDKNIIYILESQSDLAQGDFLKHLNRVKNDPKYKQLLERSIKNSESSIEGWHRMLETGYNDFGQKIADYDFRLIEEQWLPSEINRLNKYKTLLEDPTQKIYLIKNYLQKQLLENLRYAAENNHTIMRYPTPETAAKIEGFQKNEKTREFIELEDELDKLIANQYKDLPDEINLFTNENIRYTDEHRAARIQELENALADMQINQTDRTYSDQHLTILNKYKDFPKLFKKLYKNQEVRIVTDNKGNTWYEVDVPENFLQQEWQYRSGGKVKLLKRYMK